MKYRAQESKNTRTTTRLFQCLSINFAFAGQRSNDKNTAVDFVGYGGETCCLLIYDHFTEKPYGATRTSKVSAVAWLCKLLRQQIPEDSAKDD
jgi:hypothetical protein